MRQKQINKKGFTLVEVIVVLVVLAILAAILVPSMIGWINKANEKTSLIDGKNLLQAAQAIMTEKYAEDTKAFGGSDDFPTLIRFASDEYKEIVQLSEVSGCSTDIENPKIYIKNWKVDSMIYEKEDAVVKYYATDRVDGGKSYKAGFTVESNK